MAKKDVLVVASKVKSYIKSKKCHTSADTIGALSEQIESILSAAVKRTLANRRSTVKPQDL
jgi:predicted transcriptional regulator